MQVVPSHRTNTPQASLTQRDKIGTVVLPDFSSFQFNTKTAPTMSEAGYRCAIVEQAEKDQAAGKFQTDSAGFRSLSKSFVSTSSPDRKAIITQGLQEIVKSSQQESETPNIVALLLGNVKYQKSGKNISYCEFYDNNGEMVATYSNGNWNFYETHSETARQSELLSIYNSAWSAAARAAQTITIPSGAEASSDGSTLNILV